MGVVAAVDPIGIMKASTTATPDTAAVEVAGRSTSGCSAVAMAVATEAAMITSGDSAAATVAGNPRHAPLNKLQGRRSPPSHFSIAIMIKIFNLCSYVPPIFVLTFFPMCQ